MKRIALALAALGAALAVTTGAFATSSAGRLTATDGPGFTISMSAKAVKAGVYTITVKDRREQEDVGRRGRHLHVEGHAEEGHLPLRL